MFAFLQKLFIFKVFQPFFTGIRDFFIPSSYFSWKTMIYLSLFSWLMSWLAFGLEATRFTVMLLTSFSWLFLSFGVGWGLQANNVKLFGIPLAPWVAGAILCGFIFGLIPGDQQELAIVSWPLISALIIIVPQFLTWDGNVKIPPPMTRQQVILIFLISLLLSSWLQFYFRLQNWFDDYPSLMAESFDGSGFVYRVPGRTAPLSDGVALLTLTESALQRELHNRPWSGVERWLLNINDQLVSLRREIRDRLVSPSREQRFWRIDVRPVTASNGYDLKLQAIWQGPTAEPNGYYLERTCQLTRVERPATGPATGLTPGPATGLAPAAGVAPAVATGTTPWSNLECDLQTERKTGRPA
ncbi:MAG: DUF5357 family protein [Cyanobacteria bacterium Co-bin13]|nr:DUF5357 family protein [Cyanobacteria bacterium Co-bin13]